MLRMAEAILQEGSIGYIWQKLEGSRMRFTLLADANHCNCRRSAWWHDHNLRATGQKAQAA